MKLKKYTQEEFDAFPVVDGWKLCPLGDYSLIKSFGEGCRFGERCSFGLGCRFGERCCFGEGCRFGEWCSFGEWCRFGEECRFGRRCSFGLGCRFGEWCCFGEGCRFGEWCSFGEWCGFDKECICEFGKFQKLATVGGFGSEARTTYFFLLNDGGVSVRCGCFAGTLEEWESKVKETHGDSAFAKSYLLAGQAVRALWEIEQVTITPTTVKPFSTVIRT